MIDTRFNGISNSTPLGNTADWDFPTDTPDEELAFYAGTYQDVELEVGAGETFGAHVTEPTRVDQRVEAEFSFGSTLDTTAYVGVFCRYVDVDNYVLLRCNQNTRTAQLIEVIAGTPTVLATAPLTAGGGEEGGSICLECIGQRARYWFEPRRRPAGDHPPDGAVTLAGDYGSATGEWGLYGHSAAGASDMRFQRFQAWELPSQAMSPPHLVATTAPSSYALAAITCTVGSVGGDAYELEWEVYPMDGDDFPDPYKDVTLASITTRVLRVRAGHAYDVRVREISAAGVASAWTDFERIVASGSKASSSSATLPNDEFPDVTPDYVLDRDQVAIVTGHIAATGRERVSSPYPTPQNTFKLVFENRTKDDIQPLLAFFKDCQGRDTPFKWVHPISGEQFAVRFGADERDFQPLSPRPTVAEGVIGRLEFTLVEDVVDGVGQPTLDLTVDPELL